MAQINVNNLTFYYEGSFEHIFDNVSISIDTDWRLGFIGRNGKGKTTFLNLLLGKYEYTGSISTSTLFDYFPYQTEKKHLKQMAVEFADEMKPGCEQWRILCELDKLGLPGEVLYRPFGTLSFGERTKVLLAVLFSGENDFLLIDEPTNHLDTASREIVKKYLASKKGFILVSHDRDLMDACIDHVLVLNRHSIEVQKGNFSSWWENRCYKETFARGENEKHLKEISKLNAAAKRSGQWADKNERTKIGFDPVKEHDRSIATRAFIGAKTRKMQSRVKQMENRIAQEIKEKEGLLKDVESTAELRLMSMKYHKETLVRADHYGLRYMDAKEPLFTDLGFEIRQGECVFLNGTNGCGKSSLIKGILSKIAGEEPGKNGLVETGVLRAAPGLSVSYINQDTSFLRGGIRQFCIARQLDESLFCTILRQLGMERAQFVRPIEEYSEGQKKKVLIAASLITPAHLYIWDEPLNYIDVFSRLQLEKLLTDHHPTMLVVEHDVRFCEKLADKVVHIV